MRPVLTADQTTGDTFKGTNSFRFLTTGASATNKLYLEVFSPENDWIPIREFDDEGLDWQQASAGLTLRFRAESTGIKVWVDNGGP